MEDKYCLWIEEIKFCIEESGEDNNGWDFMASFSFNICSRLYKIMSRYNAVGAETFSLNKKQEKRKKKEIEKINYKEKNCK